MPAINLRGRMLEYTVVNGKASRYTYLRFNDEVLEIVTPRPKTVDAEAIIKERQAWVLKHLDQISRRAHVLTGDWVMFDGTRMRIVFEKTSGAEGLEPDMARATVTIRAPARSSIKELVRRWFLKESSAYVVRELPRLAMRFGVTYRRADVREIRNWGYCTSGGRLTFSWQLIALPARLREYVLCHELVHLSEHNHSRAFRQMLASMLPDHRQREEELNSTIPL